MPGLIQELHLTSPVPTKNPISPASDRPPPQVWLIRNGPPKADSSTEEKLAFYKYFKQATEGDVQGSQPWAVQVAKTGGAAAARAAPSRSAWPPGSPDRQQPCFVLCAPCCALHSPSARPLQLLLLQPPRRSFEAHGSPRPTPTLPPPLPPPRSLRRAPSGTPGTRSRA